MVARLDQSTLVHHQDEIGTFDRRETMGDHQGRSPLQQATQSLLHATLRLVVERTRRLIEHQYRRVLQQSPRDRNSLTLPTREHRASLTYRCIETLRQILGKIEHMGIASRFLDRRIIGSREIERNVGADAVIEQHDFLTDEANLSTQICQPIVTQVMTIEQHSPGGRIIETRQKTRERGLAATRLTDDGDRLPRLHAKADLREHLTLHGRVSERDVTKLELAARGTKRTHTTDIFDRRIEYLENAGARCDALLQRTEDLHEATERRRDEQQSGQERHELIDSHFGVEHLPDREIQHTGKAERRDQLHHRVSHRTSADQAHVAVTVTLVSDVEEPLFMTLGVEDFDDLVTIERLLGNSSHITHRGLNTRTVSTEGSIDVLDQPRDRRRQHQHERG